MSNCTYRMSHLPSEYKWSGSAIPKIGEHVKLNTEWQGGTILAYFIEYGWLGFHFDPDVRPAWWVKQNNNRRDCLGFGCDIVYP